MSIEVAVILFIAGVILVVKGGDLFVDAASWIAKASGIPSLLSARRLSVWPPPCRR